MSNKTVWAASGLIVAIGAVAFLSYHETPSGKDAAGTIVAAKRVYVDATSASGGNSQTDTNTSDTSASGNGSDRSGAASGDAKGGDAKGGDAKGGDAKGGDAKGGDAKGGDAKGGDAALAE